MIAQQKTMVVFATNCSKLVKMVSTPLDWPAFSIHLEEFARTKEFFSNLSISFILHVLNTKADRLARSAHLLPYDIMYVHYVLPVWITRTILIL